MSKFKADFQALALLLVCFISGIVYADDEKIRPALSSPTCKTFTGFPVVSISRDGNITDFHGTSQPNHFFYEGYALCSTGVNRYSINFDESGFSPSSCVCAGASCTVTRNTSDGKLQFVQKFTKAAQPLRTIDIQMTVKNISGSSVGGVFLRRMVNTDIAGGVNEFYAETKDAVFSWGTKTAGIPYGVALRHITKAPTSTTTSTYTSPYAASDYTGCIPVSDLAADGPEFGDFVSSIVYSMGSIGAGASKSTTVQYARD